MVKENKPGEGPLDLFLKIGLDERTAKNTVANSKVTSNLTAVIHQADVTDGCNRMVGNLLYTVATKFPANALAHRQTLLKHIVSSKIKTPAQLDAAFAFLTKIGPENFKLEAFEEACGVGVEVSAEEIELVVSEVFAERKSIILEQRYRTNVGELLGPVRKKLPWADPKIIKQNVDAKLYELLGERTAADDEKPSKKKEKPVKVEEKKPIVDDPPQQSEEDLNPFVIFPPPEENFKVHTEVFFSDGSILRCSNTKELLDKQLKITGGKIGANVMYAFRYAFPIKCTDVVLAEDGETVVEIQVEYDPLKKIKPKGVLHWVAQPAVGVEPLQVEVRLFDKLFLSENLADLDNWLADLIPQSKIVIPGAYAIPSLRDSAVGESFQFERLGYFMVDKDSTKEKLIFNRTVMLRHSYDKAGK